MAKSKAYKPAPKNGRERVRRSFVVYKDTADKFGQIARVSGVQSSELLQQVIQQVVDAWELQHGEILHVGADNIPSVNLSTAIRGAQAAPVLKRGNPHPVGRKPKNAKQ